jgi:hypothetical protein
MIMAVGTFEPQDKVFLSGTIEAEVLDPNGVEPVTIIRVSDLWQVHATWSMKGQNAKAYFMANALWHVVVYAESIGPNPEMILTELDVPMNPPLLKVGINEYRYESNFNINKGLLSPGPYKIVTVITAVYPDRTPIEMAAYCEGPIVQFYSL